MQKFSMIVLFTSIVFVILCAKQTPEIISQNTPRYLFFWTLFIFSFLIVKEIFKNSKNQFNLISILLLFNIIYFHFTILNFLSDRYALAIMLNNLILLGVFLSKLIELHFSKGIIFTVLSLVGSLVTTISRSKPLDVTMASYDAMQSHKETILFLERNNFYNKKIFAGFLLQNNLLQTSKGYRTSPRKFNFVKNSTEKFSNFDFAIIDNIETTTDTSLQKCLEEFVAIKNFRVRNVNTIIYKRK